MEKSKFSTVQHCIPVYVMSTSYLKEHFIVILPNLHTCWL